MMVVELKGKIIPVMQVPTGEKSGHPGGVVFDHTYTGVKPTIVQFDYSLECNIPASLRAPYTRSEPCIIINIRSFG